MWLDMLELGGGAVFTIVTIITAVTTLVRRIVDSRVTPIMSKLDEHDREHSQERRQVAAAMKRNGLDPPDGWNGRPVSRSES